MHTGGLARTRRERPDRPSGAAIDIGASGAFTFDVRYNLGLRPRNENATSTKRPQGAAAVNRGLPVQDRAWQEWRDRARQRIKLHERTRPANAGRNGGTEKSKEPDRLGNSRPF